MGHKLPTADSPLRELFDVQQIVDVTTGREPVALFREALIRARRSMRENKAIRSIIVLAVDSSTDDLCLYRVGCRGGHKRLWVFGPIGRNARLA